MPQSSGATAGLSVNAQIRLSTYRAQRVLGPILIVLGVVIAVGGLFDAYTPGRISAALNAGLVPLNFGMLMFSLGYYGEQIIQLKRRIAELESGESGAAK